MTGLEDYIIYSNNKTLRHILLKVPLAIYLTKNKNTILLIMKSFKLDKTFKKRNKIGSHWSPIHILLKLLNLAFDSLSRCFLSEFVNLLFGPRFELECNVYILTMKINRTLWLTEVINLFRR
jgi:hypothetical protein